jgi:hypothetical protein
MRVLISAALLALSALTAAAAWDNHAQLSYLALESELRTSAAPAGLLVPAESLEGFVAAEKAKLPALLDGLEKEAVRDIDAYRPRPAALAFTGAEADLRLAFIHAIRVNPRVPFALYVQLQAGVPRDSRPDLPVLAEDGYDNHLPNGPFKALAPGEAVRAIEVLASATDEPDYGMDIGLFEDNKSEVSTLYGFGVQPFGNPALAYGSQAPFHMIFSSEPGIIKTAAPFTRTSLTEGRYRLYTELARFAFAEGHPYWGYRFAGWALHYLQDVAQPYHSNIIPAKTGFGVLWFYLTSSQAAKDAELVLLSNRHLVLEDYLYGAMAAFKGDTTADPLYAALAGPAPASGLPRDAKLLFRQVTKRAYARGRSLDRLLVATFPRAWTSDPALDFGASGAHDSYGELQRTSAEKARAFETACAPIFGELAAACRLYLGLLGAGAGGP